MLTQAKRGAKGVPSKSEKAVWIPRITMHAHAVPGGGAACLECSVPLGDGGEGCSFEAGITPRNVLVPGARPCMQCPSEGPAPRRRTRLLCLAQLL